MKNYTYPKNYINLKYSNWIKHAGQLPAVYYLNKTKLLTQQKGMIRNMQKAYFPSKNIEEASEIFSAIAYRAEDIFAKAFAYQPNIGKRKSSSAAIASGNYSFAQIGTSEAISRELAEKYIDTIKDFQRNLQAALDVIMEDIGSLEGDLQKNILNELLAKNNLLQGNSQGKKEIIDKFFNSSRYQQGAFFLPPGYEGDRKAGLALGKLTMLIYALDSLIGPNVTEGSIDSQSKLLKKFAGVIGGSLNYMAGAAEEIAEHEVFQKGSKELLGELSFINSFLGGQEGVKSTADPELEALLRKYGGARAVKNIEQKGDLHLQITEYQVQSTVIAASVKKATPTQTSFVEIKARGKTPLLRALYEASLYQDNSFMTAFINLSAGQADDDRGEPSLAVEWALAVENIGVASMLHAITGQSQGGKDALIFIVNRKVFSVEQLFDMLIYGAVGYEIKISGNRFANINQKRDTPKERSDFIRGQANAELYKIKIAYKLFFEGSSIGL